MAEKSPKSPEELSVEPLATRERNLPRHLSDYIDVPGQNSLQTVKNRRKTMRSNLTKKINAVKVYMEERKNRKLIELALTQLNRAWDQLIENHKEFWLCSDDQELQDADTWLLESQAIVEELICKAVEYQEHKIDSSGSDFSVCVEAKRPKKVDPTEIPSVSCVGDQSSKKSSSKMSKTTSCSSRNRAKMAAREADLAKLKVEQLKEKAQLEAEIAQLVIKEAEQEADRKEKEALLSQGRG